VGKGERFGSWEEAAGAIQRNQQPAFPNYRAEDWLVAAHRHCREEGGKIVFDYDPAIADAFKTVGAPPAVDLWPLFAALAQKPLLIIRGELSELLSRGAARKMRGAAPSAAFVEVGGVGHAPMLDEPEAVAAIDAFLANVSA
jgi:pimeloyl-ACP methyl ester carboxylesterase